MQLQLHGKITAPTESMPWSRLPSTCLRQRNFQKRTEYTSKTGTTVAWLNTEKECFKPFHLERTACDLAIFYNINDIRGKVVKIVIGSTYLYRKLYSKRSKIIIPRCSTSLQWHQGLASKLLSSSLYSQGETWSSGCQVSCELQVNARPTTLSTQPRRLSVA